MANNTTPLAIAARGRTEKALRAAGYAPPDVGPQYGEPPKATAPEPDVWLWVVMALGVILVGSGALLVHVSYWYH